MIRRAVPSDAKKLLDIYGYYIENTAITYEYTIPTIVEFAKRIEDTLEKYPYLVYEDEGDILGYAYAGAFNQRAAARWTAETSIYVKKEAVKKGIGKQLYFELEKQLREQKIVKVVALIAAAEKEDPYITSKSIEFHKYMGYELSGRIKKCAYKFGNWYDLVYMEKQIGEYSKRTKEGN